MLTMKDICTYEVWNITFLIVEKFDIGLKDWDFVVGKWELSHWVVKTDEFSFSFS